MASTSRPLRSTTGRTGTPPTSSRASEGRTPEEAAEAWRAPRRTVPATACRRRGSVLLPTAILISGSGAIRGRGRMVMRYARAVRLSWRPRGRRAQTKTRRCVTLADTLDAAKTHGRSDVEPSLEAPAEEVTRLRDCLNDVASIMALPAQSTAGEPGHVVGHRTRRAARNAPGGICMRAVERSGGWAFHRDGASR